MWHLMSIKGHYGIPETATAQDRNNTLIRWKYETT